LSIIKRLISIAVPVVVLGVLINEIVHTPIYTDRELASFRERDVAMARRGEFDEALRALKALSEIVPDDPLVWGDYLSVLAWARRDQEAVQLAQDPKLPLLPAYALAELFEAALRIHDYAAAQRFAIAEIQHNDNPEKVAVTRVDRLREAGAEAQVGAVIEAGLKRVPDSGPLLSRIEAPAPAPAPEATVAAPPEPSAAAPAIPAAPAVATPAAKAPGAPAARSTASRGRAFSKTYPTAARAPAARVAPAHRTTAARAATPAADAAVAGAAPPSARAIAAERARHAVQAAEHAAPGAPRIELANVALAEIDRYIELLQAEAPDDAGALRNARLDRVHALNLAGRPADAAALFESLGDPADFPVYGLLNGADAYMRQHQPERAQKLLDLALAKAPDDTTVLGAIFYNQLDQERYADAGATLKKLQALDGPEVVDGRASWIARLGAMFDAYQNRLASAQEKLEALRIHALNDPELDMNLATVYRWRGWARRALPEYGKAAADGGDAIAARAGVANAQMDMQRFSQADVTINHLLAEAPQHPDAIDVKTRWDWFNRYEYIAQVQAGRSTESRVNGSGDLTFDQWLYSKPIADNYRVFVHHHYDWADFDEGAGHVHRVGIGGDYRSEPFDLALSLNQRAPGGRLGVAVAGEYRVGDGLSFFGDVQSDSDQIPLRAIRNDDAIHGPSFTVGAGYRWDESRSARLAYTRVQIGDGEYRNGNPIDEDTRQSLSASYRQDVYRDARHRIALVGDLYYSRNSADDSVPYFNPSSERAAQLSVDYNGILQRRGDRVWSHRATAGVGAYEQQGYGTDPIGSLQYEQRWDFGPAFSVNYGLLYRSRVYDGDREGYAAVFGGIRWRF
jgi:biofilm PGA synthesis protein PgaA